MNIQALGEREPPPAGQLIPRSQSIIVVIGHTYRVGRKKSYNLPYPALGKIPLQNSWIRIVIRISTKIDC